MRASSIVNHAALSTSGKLRCSPDRGGHSISKVLLVVAQRVDVATHRPRVHALASRLTDFAEVETRARRGASAELFGELRFGAGAGVVALVVFAFGDRPCAGVLARPERAPGMDEQHLDTVRRVDAVEKEPRTHPRHRRLTLCRWNGSQSSYWRRGNACVWNTTWRRIPK